MGFDVKTLQYLTINKCATGKCFGNSVIMVSTLCVWILTPSSPKYDKAPQGDT